jgi:hypothetical protein
VERGECGFGGEHACLLGCMISSVVYWL